MGYVRLYPPSIFTRRFVSCAGMDHSKSCSTRLKRAVVRPMPKASVATTTSVKPGLLARARAPNRISSTNVIMRPSSNWFVPPDQLGSSFHAQLREDIRYVEFDRPLRYGKDAGNLLVRPSPYHRVQYLRLPRAQHRMGSQLTIHERLHTCRVFEQHRFWHPDRSSVNCGDGGGKVSLEVGRRLNQAAQS